MKMFSSTDTEAREIERTLVRSLGLNQSQAVLLCNAVKGFLDFRGYTLDFLESSELFSCVEHVWSEVAESIRPPAVDGKRLAEAQSRGDFEALRGLDREYQGRLRDIFRLTTMIATLGHAELWALASAVLKYLRCSDHSSIADRLRVSGLSR
jgi:hypothetical protein